MCGLHTEEVAPAVMLSLQKTHHAASITHSRIIDLLFDTFYHVCAPHIRIMLVDSTADPVNSTQAKAPTNGSNMVMVSCQYPQQSARMSARGDMALICLRCRAAAWCTTWRPDACSECHAASRHSCMRVNATVELLSLIVAPPSSWQPPSLRPRTCCEEAPTQWHGCQRPDVVTRILRR
jgi:hypothetical protein